MKAYETEVKERWGETDAYQEHQKKTQGYSKEKWAEVNEGLLAFFARFAQLKNSGRTADSAESRAIVVELKDYITAHYYTCTPQILASLAESYAGGGSMTENIDKAGGAGTGAFAKEVIDCYIQKCNEA